MPACDLTAYLPTTALLALLLAVPAVAQEEFSTFEGTVEVSEVMLDLLALDAEGQPVLGLSEGDFVVVEDGEEVPITSISYYTTRYDEGVEKAGEVPASRFFILFFHDQTRFRYYGNRLILQQIKAGQHCRRWLRDHREPSDWVAVVQHNGELTVYQDFTQDAEALDVAVKRAAAGKKPVSGRAGGRGGRDRPVSLMRYLEAPEQRGKGEDIHTSLGRLANATSHILGRKNLMLFTTGFGKENQFHQGTKPDPDRYPQLESLLNDFNVAVYPIDLTPPGRPARHHDFLEILANDTGGTYHEDFVGFINPMKDVGKENVGYYLLSYVSARPAGEIGYQRLEVRAKNPEIEVRARKGYRFGL